jgi:nitrogen fixation protein FixH
MNTFYLVIAVAVIVVILTWLALRSGSGYSVHDTEAHSTNYADVIKEGHGGLTLCLWVSFITIIIWTIVYLVQHASEFLEVFTTG